MKIREIILILGLALLFTACEDDPILEKGDPGECPPGVSYCKLNLPSDSSYNYQTAVLLPKNPKVF